jgi:hypothetical protein
LRIVVRAADARSARDVQALLAAADIQAAAIPGAYRPAPDGEDICVAPVAETVLAANAQTSDQPPLACLAAHNNAAPPPLGLASASPFTGAITLDAPAKLLRAQMDAWIRVAIAEEERARRAATAVEATLARMGRQSDAQDLPATAARTA